MPADDNSMGGTSGLTGEMGAPAPAAAPPPQPVASDASAMLQPQAAPDMPAVATPVQPHGVMKILDFVGNLLTGGGNNPDVISRDPETGARVVSPGRPMTTGRKFAQAGLEALEGAATAAGAPPGPGHTGRGVAAAVGQQLALQHDREQQAEAMADKDFDEQQKTKLNNLNYQLLSRELISKQLADERAGKVADREQTEFSNRLQDRERALGSYDLGFVKDAKTIADLGNSNPGMIAKYHQGLIVPIPVYGEHGETLGLQVFERKPNANAAPLPAGQQIHRFTPPAKPGDAPKYELFTPTNMSTGEATNADMKAFNDYQAWQSAQQKKAESEATVSEKKAATAKDYAEAGKANADAEATRKTMAASTGPYIPGVNPILDDTAEGLASGRYTLATLPKRTGKGQPTPQEQMFAANQVSMQKYGLPYNPTIIDQENKFATNTKTQAYLEGIDRMTGAHGDAGQLNQILTLAKQAGIGENAPLNEARQWVKKKMGNTAAKNFDTLLTETQSNLGTLIGNPLLGSGESDKKLQTAREAFGANPTLSNLKGQVQIVSDVLNRSRADMAANNRYIQQRYGTRLSPPQTQTQTQTAQMPPRPQEVAPGSYYIQASDKTFHWIPKDQLDAAKGIDKTLSVIGQAN